MLIHEFSLLNRLVCKDTKYCDRMAGLSLYKIYRKFHRIYNFLFDRNIRIKSWFPNFFKPGKSSHKVDIKILITYFGIDSGVGIHHIL